MAPVPVSSRRQVQGDISRLIAQWRLAPAPSWPAKAHNSAAASACVCAIIVCAVRGWSRYWRARTRVPAGAWPTPLTRIRKWFTLQFFVARTLNYTYLVPTLVIGYASANRNLYFILIIKLDLDRLCYDFIASPFLDAGCHNMPLNKYLKVDYGWWELTITNGDQ